MCKCGKCKDEFSEDKSTVEIELSLENFAILALEAHEKDITFNQHVCNILRKFINKQEES